MAHQPDRLSQLPTACTLPTTEQPMRLADVDDLLTAAVTAVERPSDGRALLAIRAEPAVVAQVAEFCARETACCSFFSFTLTMDDAGCHLLIAVPAAQQAVLDAIVARASVVAAGV